MSASVFVSAGNADYSAARTVCRFLDESGVACFFCDESMLRAGERNYQAAVDRALAAAEQVLVVTASAARAESEWVKYAWQGFVSGRARGGRRGSVVTVLCEGVERGALPGALRRGRCIRFPEQLSLLPQVLEGSVAPDKAEAAQHRTESRSRRFLVLITACNVIILGLMLWLLERHGRSTLPGTAPQPAGGPDSRARSDLFAGNAPGRNDAAGAARRTVPTAGAAVDGNASAAGTESAAVILNAEDHPDSAGTGAGTAANLSGTPAPGTSIALNLGDGAGTGFCFIPAGEFVMGSPPHEAGRDDDERQHSVRIGRNFWMSRYECRQSVWQAVMGSNPSASIHSQSPVESVSWNEVAEGTECFLARINRQRLLPEGWRFALPTEAQWEYACRAGTTTPFSFGSILDGTLANCDGTLPYGTPASGPNLRRTTAAGSYLPNAWGLCDMHGNVWEWCADHYESDPRTGPDTLSTSGATRVQRGGSWRFNAGLCRSASRQGVNPEVGDDTLGFRLAIVPSQ